MVEVLESCDYICNVLPKTPDTVGTFDGDVFQHCANKVRIAHSSQLSYM